MVDLKGTFGS